MDVSPELYDINFCFPVPPTLESERVHLTPFIPSKHAESFMHQALLYPEIFTYLPFGPFNDAEDFVANLFETRIHPDPGYILFVIYDKTKPAASSSSDPGALAGLLGLINSSAVNLSTEIGCIMIFPPFQRTHLASNAIGILLQYALNLPARQPGALGLRRVFWQANVLNKPSVRLAERMGFKLEGILRWDRVLPKGKDAGNGKELREGDPRMECVGRDTAMLGHCWDDWESGGRENVEATMRRIK
ncbi:hypothetical protein GALMADRAFT_125640 [Galerina marginata CBS 339.88]|uniref:N-acetyltransferase domain-containing protein n=1 Tax=Galerina marginata (strain CBS 339.88) TaxID=685588 RepID=A0A067SS03_GALM3|nr:hypothetical protein GALMADRAFT_125640 [Galerina marginata CBS 339.88]